MKRITLCLTAAVAAGCGDSSFDVSQATFSQVDYMGRPAISTVFIPSTGKDAYNETLCGALGDVFTINFQHGGIPPG